jgi:cytochrome c553
MWKRRGSGLLLPLFVLPALSAAAQDAVHGKLLYHDLGRLTGTGVSCVDCHGGVPGALHGLEKVASDPSAVAYALGAVPQMAPLRGKLSASDMADIAAYVAAPSVPSPGLRHATSGPAASPYSDQRLEFTTAGRSWVRLTNAGALSVRLEAAPIIVGPHATDFRIVASECAAGPLVPGQSCTIEVAFAPTGEGLRTAALRIAHDWIGGAAAFALLGRPGAAVTKP